MTKLIQLTFICASCVCAQVSGRLAIRDARIVTVSGPVIDKGTIVVQDGLIQSVGANVSVPADAWVIDGQGLTVYPGLFDALSTIGIPDAVPPSNSTSGRSGGVARAPTPAPATPPPPRSEGPEDRPATTSWSNATDLIQTSDRRIESFRSAGFTTAATFPVRGIFAGQGAIIDLAGEKPGQMVVMSPVGQYVTMSTSGSFGSFPGSLMGTIAYIRQVYLDASHYKLVQAAYARNPRGMTRPDYDRALEGVLASPRLLLPANREVEMARMLRFGKELDQPFVLYGMHEGFRAAGLLKNSGVPVLVSLKWPERDKDADPDEQEPLRILEMWDQAPSTPALLAAAGVRFALYTDSLATPKDVLKAVKRALDAGLKPADAIRAMTLSPAEIYGVADRLGSIDTGKIANLVVTKGDLFQDKTEVKYVIVDGAKFEPVPEPAPAPARGESR